MRSSFYFPLKAERPEVFSGSTPSTGIGQQRQPQRTVGPGGMDTGVYTPLQLLQEHDAKSDTGYPASTRLFSSSVGV